VKLFKLSLGRFRCQDAGRRLHLLLFGGGNQMALVAFFYRPSASASALHAILQLTANSQEKGARIHKGMGQSPWAPFVVADGNRLDIPSIISAYHSPTSIDIWLMAKMSPKCRPRQANKQLFKRGRGPA